MTVRVVVTASGRGERERHRLCARWPGDPSRGASHADARPGAIDGALRIELERALAVGDRASNAVLQERDGRWAVQGDPTEGALVVAARKAGLEDEALDARFQRVWARCPLLVRAEADDDDSYRCAAERAACSLRCGSL